MSEQQNQENQLDPSINIDAALNNMNLAKQEVPTEETVASTPQADQVAPTQEEVVAQPTAPTQQSAPVQPAAEEKAPVTLGETYNHPHVDEPTTGIIIEKKETQVNHPNPYDLNKDTMDGITAYMQDMEKTVQGHAELENKVGLRGEATQEEEDDSEGDKEPSKEELEELAREREEKYNTAVIVIDKFQADSIQLTDDERLKLERVSKIKIQEVETLELKTLKTRKKPKNSVDKIIKRMPTVHHSAIVLPGSGYTAKLRGASSYELVSLMTEANNALLDAETKWSLLHSKITETSIGNMPFNDFLRATSATDYNTLVYGLLLATYPDDDTVPLTCENPKCKHSFQQKFAVASLLRAEQMSEKLQETVRTIVAHSHSEEHAQLAHNDAAVNTVQRIKLPVSGVIVDLQTQSAYDLIYNSIKSIVESEDEEANRYAQASMLATLVRDIYVPIPDTPEDDPEYFHYTNAMEITKIIYSLQDKDIITLSNQGDKMSDAAFEYGFMNVRCPKCAHIHEYIPFDIESILFYRYQQSMNTSVE